mgnify:FL=1
MTQLYKLADELMRVQDEVESAEGVLDSDLEKRLDDCALDFKAKVENIGKLVLSLSSNSDAIDHEITRLKHRKTITDNLQKRLMDYLKFQMQRTDTAKIEFPAFSVTVCKNPTSLKILDEGKLPTMYFTVVPQHLELDKAGRERLKDDLKKGIDVNGAAVLETGTHLRVK